MASRDPVTRLADYRILAMGHHIEESLEAFQDRLLEHLPEEVRAEAAAIREQGPGHKAMADAYDELKGAIDEAVEAASPSDVLQVMIDTERIAHDFYLSALDDLRDGALIDTMHDMAREEADHIDILRGLRSRL